MYFSGWVIIEQVNLTGISNKQIVLKKKQRFTNATIYHCRIYKFNARFINATLYHNRIRKWDL